MPFFSLLSLNSSKNSPVRRSAFTLIEMLVVIVLISLLATILVSALRSAQRQARSALCQSRLKNLHQACMNYFSDNGHYPYAGSFEFYNTFTQKYYHHRGWVAWVRQDGKRAKDVADPWKADNSNSHADDYVHADWQGTTVERSIMEGSIFKYANRDLVTYRCPEFAIAHNRRNDLLRTYQMNRWFGSRRQELHRNRRPEELQTAGIEASRMGYIAELGHEGDTKLQDPPTLLTELGSKKGEKARSDVGKRKIFVGDSVWEYPFKEFTNDDERFGGWHKKAGKIHGHVIFLDGHIESLTDTNPKNNDNYKTQNDKLGNAKF